MTLHPNINGICGYCGHDRNDARDMLDVSCGCECHNGFDINDEPDIDITIISISEPDKDN